MALVVTNKQAILPGEVVFMLQFTSRFIFGNFQMVSLHFTEVCKCLTVETRVSTFGHCKFNFVMLPFSVSRETGSMLKEETK